MTQSSELKLPLDPQPQALLPVPISGLSPTSSGAGRKLDFHGIFCLGALIMVPAKDGLLTG